MNLDLTTTEVWFEENYKLKQLPLHLLRKPHFEQMQNQIQLLEIPSSKLMILVDAK